MLEFHYQIHGQRRRVFRHQGHICSIGTARSNDLVVQSRSLAKRHAQLQLKTDGIYLTDLGGVSGCWVNQQRIDEYGPLSGLDEVILGEVSIQVHRGPRAANNTDLHNQYPVKNRAGLQRRIATTHTSTADRPFVLTQEKKPAQEKAQASTEATATVERHFTVPNAASNSVTTDNNRKQVEAIRKSSALHAVEPPHHHELALWSNRVHEQLLYQMDIQRKDIHRMSDEQLRSESTVIVRAIIQSLAHELPAAISAEVLHDHVLNEAVGLGPLEQFLQDDDVSEIMVNTHKDIFVEKHGCLQRATQCFSSDRAVYSVIERIITPLGRRIDESSPIVDARLKDGSRVNAIIPPLALNGPSLTIRKFSKKRMQFADLVQSDSLSQEMVEFLRIGVQMRKNIIVSGGTGSGKTTLLNVLSNFIPDTDRVVTIEDAAELKLVQPNLVALEARNENLEGKGAVSIRDLVRNALRMRPDRIVVGECRGGEALDMLQAMNTGHDGSLTTLHANNPRDALSRLEVLVLMAGIELPILAIREQVASAVHLIVQQNRFACGSRKITRISEVVGIESGTVQLQDIFEFRQEGVDPSGKVRGHFSATGHIPAFYEQLRNTGMALSLDTFTHRVGCH